MPIEEAEEKLLTILKQVMEEKLTCSNVEVCRVAVCHYFETRQTCRLTVYHYCETVEVCRLFVLASLVPRSCVASGKSGDKTGQYWTHIDTAVHM